MRKILQIFQGNISRPLCDEVLHPARLRGQQASIMCHGGGDVYHPLRADQISGTQPDGLPCSETPLPFRSTSIAGPEAKVIIPTVQGLLNYSSVFKNGSCGGHRPGTGTGECIAPALL